MSYRFNAKCNGCSACVHQCPTGAITGEFQVKYVIDPLKCIDCGVCGMICDVEAVEDPYGLIAKRIPRDQRPRPVVNVDQCNGCGLCVDFCPFTCLSLVGSAHSGLTVLSEPLACVSCGECASICLKGAVTMSALDLGKFDPGAEHERCERVLDEYLEANRP